MGHMIIKPTNDDLNAIAMDEVIQNFLLLWTMEAKAPKKITIG